MMLDNLIIILLLSQSMQRNSGEITAWHAKAKQPRHQNTFFRFPRRTRTRDRITGLPEAPPLLSLPQTFQAIMANVRVGGINVQVLRLSWKQPVRPGFPRFTILHLFGAIMKFRHILFSPEWEVEWQRSLRKSWMWKYAWCSWTKKITCWS